MEDKIPFIVFAILAIFLVFSLNLFISKEITVKWNAEKQRLEYKVYSAKETEPCYDACESWYYSNFVFNGNTEKLVDEKCKYFSGLSRLKKLYACAFYLEGWNSLMKGEDSFAEFVSKASELGLEIDEESVKDILSSRDTPLLAKIKLMEAIANGIKS